MLTMFVFCLILTEITGFAMHHRWFKLQQVVFIFFIILLGVWLVNLPKYKAVSNPKLSAT